MKPISKTRSVRICAKYELTSKTRAWFGWEKTFIAVLKTELSLVTIELRMGGKALSGLTGHTHDT